MEDTPPALLALKPAGIEMDLLAVFSRERETQLLIDKTAPNTPTDASLAMASPFKQPAENLVMIVDESGESTQSDYKNKASLRTEAIGKAGIQREAVQAS